MTFLSQQLGPFPLGIWLVLAVLTVTGLGFTLAAQTLSLCRWSTAHALGLQEDSPQSADPLEKTLAAVSWGEALADIVIQTTLIALTFIGIFIRHPVGLYAGIAQAVLWLYVCCSVLAQRYALYHHRLTPDLARFRHLAPPLILIAGLPSLLMILCLLSNRPWFFPAT